MNFYMLFHVNIGSGQPGHGMVWELALSRQPIYFRTRACCICGRCGWGLFGYVSLAYHLFSFSLCLRYGLI